MCGNIGDGVCLIAISGIGPTPAHGLSIRATSGCLQSNLVVVRNPCVLDRQSPRTGILREEVWQDDQGELVRYNLAFINHFLCGVENGRVLGYDNSHGFHHRDCKGSVTSFTYLGHDVLLDRFLAEAADLRKDKA
jgi:hypothetical protein